MSYELEIKSFQKHRDMEIREPEGWLSALGLYWLHEGANICGNSDLCDIKVPCKEEVAFTLQKTGDDVEIIVQPDVYVESNKEKVSRKILGHDQSACQDVLKYETLTIELLKRNEKLGIRVRDSNNEKLKKYPKLRWFKVDQKYKLSGKYIKHEGERTIEITIARGGEFELHNPGRVYFQIDGKEFFLEVIRQGYANVLFLIFKDQTNSIESYGAGRFLAIPFNYPEQKETDIVIDFNRSVSPPCAYTDAATCPLPPAVNTLPVAIRAGEMYVKEEMEQTALVAESQ